jgi:glycosyltransferase involved in cell wall biosynthesis
LDGDQPAPQVESKLRVLFVGRTRYPVPLTPSLERKFVHLCERFELRVLATAADGRAHDDGVFRLLPRVPLLDGPLFYLLLPIRLRRVGREHGAVVIVTQSPYEAVAARLGRIEAKVVVEVHGDWRTATRLYGSRLRWLLAPLADALCAWGIRAADAVRTVSPYTSELVRTLGIEPAAEFPTFSDLEVFTTPTRPLPDRPLALFVGVLERYKNIDGLAHSWRLAAPGLDEATLRIVGRGPLRPIVERLVRERPTQTTWTEHLSPDDLACALDEATCLVLPSRSEGLPRVIIEAFLRGRAVVAMRVGGIRDIVSDDVNGLLVETDEELRRALIRVLVDRPLAQRLGEAARRGVEPWLSTPDQFAERINELVQPLVTGLTVSSP